MCTDTHSKFMYTCHWGIFMDMFNYNKPIVYDSCK